MADSPAAPDMPNAPPEGTSADPFEGTPYRAVARLAAGGMGEVYLVEQTRLGKCFAAKLLRAELAREPRLLDRMRLEAETLGSLHHGNIVSAFDVQTTIDGRPYLVMEYLRGRTLGDEIAICGAMPVAEALGFGSQLLSALEAAHELGIVHRDIKPSNLFICDANTDPRQLKVLDFGVVRVLPNAPDHAPHPTAIPTGTGVLVGTPRYVSPEGATGAKVDTRADLYAAALMLYFMLTGRGPFDELRRDTAMLTAHAYLSPPPPSQFAREPISAELDALVLKGLAKEPNDRYQTAAEFRAVVDRLLATLRCPSQLLDTRQVGQLVRLSSDGDELPKVTKFVAPTSNITVAIGGSLALFVLVAIITAVVLLTLGQTP